MSPTSQHATYFYLGLLAGVIVSVAFAACIINTAPSLKQERQCVMTLLDRAGHSHAIEGPCISTGAIQ